MNHPLGQTRTRVSTRHAIIAPDSHVASNLPGLSDASAVVLVNEALGAKFAQLLVTFSATARADWAASQLETAGFIETGGATVSIEATQRKCDAGGYFFAPAGMVWSISEAKEGTRVTLFQKRFEPLPSRRGPRPLIGAAAEVTAQPYLDDPGARLQMLLPDEPEFDLALDVFTFAPGATLPSVETSVMEHGVLMLAGQGIFRLEDSWYPVMTGDAIWMAPFCSQWFVATGKTPASYLCCKNVNRPAM